jgi:cell wall-associated NlpC family hydrolase
MVNNNLFFHIPQQLFHYLIMNSIFKPQGSFMFKSLPVFLLASLSLSVLATGCKASHEATASRQVDKRPSSNTQSIAVKQHTTTPLTDQRTVATQKPDIDQSTPDTTSTTLIQATNKVKDTAVVATTVPAPADTLAVITKKIPPPASKEDAKAIAPATAQTESKAEIKEGPQEDATDNTAEEQPATTDAEANTLISKYAGMVNVDSKQLTNLSLYEFIDEWYGTRYKWGGTDNRGIDCSAFSQRLYDEVYNIEIMRTSRQQHRHCKRISGMDDAKEGDLVFFHIHWFMVSHVGVYLTNGYFVHTSRRHGVMISNLNDRYWSKRLAGFGKVVDKDAPTEISMSR